MGMLKQQQQQQQQQQRTIKSLKAYKSNLIIGSNILQN